MLARQLTEKEQRRFAEKQAIWRALTPEADKARAERVMARVDALPGAEWRALVHEYGLTPVESAFRNTGGNYRKASRLLLSTRIELE